MVSSGALEDLLYQTALSSCILLRIVFHEPEGVISLCLDVLGVARCFRGDFATICVDSVSD